MTVSTLTRPLDRDLVSLALDAHAEHVRLYRTALWLRRLRCPMSARRALNESRGALGRFEDLLYAAEAEA